MLFDELGQRLMTGPRVILCKGKGTDLILQRNFKQRHYGAETQKAMASRLKSWLDTFRQSFRQEPKDFILNVATTSSKRKYRGQRRYTTTSHWLSFLGE